MKRSRWVRMRGYEVAADVLEQAVAAGLPEVYPSVVRRVGDVAGMLRRRASKIRARPVAPRGKPRDTARSCGAGLPDGAASPAGFAP